MCLCLMLAKVNTTMERTWKYKQWKEPKRYLIKGMGLTVWKWCGIWFPLWSIHLGGHRSIGWDIFHNGYGFKIELQPIIILRVCVKGKIGLWYPRGLLFVKIGKWKMKY